MPDGRPPRLRRLMGEGAATGLCCAFLAIAVGLLVFLSRPRGAIRVAVVEAKELSSVVTSSIPQPRTPSALDIFNLVATAPVVETLLFLLVYWALHPRREFGLRTIVFIGSMGALGFLLHGASLMTINRIMPFALLAWLFARWAERHSLAHAYAVTALAHLVWNLAVLVPHLARRLWS